jgi:hypothetical protein
MSGLVVILVGVISAGIGFIVGFRLALIWRRDTVPTPPAMSRAEVQDLRKTALALEAKVEKLELQMKAPSLPGSQGPMKPFAK